MVAHMAWKHPSVSPFVADISAAPCSACTVVIFVQSCNIMICQFRRVKPPEEIRKRFAQSSSVFESRIPARDPFSYICGISPA